MVTFQEEAFDDVYEQMKEPLKAHWEELALHKDIRPLDVDEESYRGANAADVLQILTMREDGVLIGYAPFFIRNHMHYKTWKTAVCDVYYVDPAWRKSGYGAAFFKEILLWLKEKNVNSVVMQDKVHKPHTAMFKSLGFEHVENNYELVL